LNAVGVVLVAAALVVAGFLVVRSLRSVKPEPLPPSLKPVPPDTGLVVFRASIRRKVMNLASRCKSKRKQLGDGMTPQLDSLGRECDSAISSVLGRIAALDTMSRENRRTAADSIRAAYERAKLKVRVFARTVLDADTVNEDSLDREIKKLISE
jgi:sugar-specific transcriptional regulator TrmB